MRALLNKDKSVRAAWLYGSVARGEDGPNSDIDITVVVDSESAAGGLQESLMGLKDQFNVNFSLISLTPEDVAGQAQDSTWWASVIRDAKMLKGASPQNEFDQCALKVHSA
jgi:predicted nucleotidyltransferase